MIATQDLAEELRATLRGKVLSHEPMVLHTSFKIGGPADLLVIPEDVKDLKAALAFARSKGLPSWVMGSGSNTLVRDGGIRGMVILPNAFQELTRVGTEVTAGAGVRVSRLLAFCCKQGLSGLEILSGVPGTVGGAVWGNAGAWGGSTSDHLARVQVVTDEGEELTLEREAIPFRYRFSGLPKGSVIVQATFALAPGDPTAIRQQISRWLVQRNTTQPVEFRSAGSIFKNPPRDYAGRLVEAAGVKGTRIGGAKISEKHGNFFVNLGDARAADVLALVALARERVRQTSGIDLELEIRVVGED
ncbi:MAG: UDP-N-acetylenolpyruvoylglucosamine reductase [candidate division NC10 bacterium RIFCSPLOWO2_02_FULL_66_22]|nr:MAG: UDP-N-acetylenolpyruvoylglucosamine reductase [candidate division NC10 bacterium RIFCSPLOWO2_02_FULL_66_22]